jgi:hypothetical protein
MSRPQLMGGRAVQRVSLRTVAVLLGAIGASVVLACSNGDSDGPQGPSPSATGPAAGTVPAGSPLPTGGQAGSGAAAGGLPGRVTLREPDGTYPNGLPNDPAFFPLGVWLETVIDPAQVRQDRSFGLNLYVGLAHDDVADLDAIEAGGMHLLVQTDEWAGDPRAGHPAVDGWVVYDEADLMYRAGSDDWSEEPGWNTCVPAQDDGGRCGYTVMRYYNDRVPPGALRYANYGLDVLYFESDAEAEVFINGDLQDVVSADDYAFTRPDVAPTDRRGAFYGRTVQRIRTLDGTDGVRQPVWSFVEVGHPFEDDAAPTITAAEARSAVWHSIIAGARGIVFFNHSFGGTCRTFSVLRAGCDPEMTPAVSELNAQITELAPVLNAPFADGYVGVDGPVEAMAKLGPDGAWYVFAGATTLGAAGGDASFSIAAGSEVEVLYEDRQLALHDGRFVDTFSDGNAVHVYRVT